MPDCGEDHFELGRRANEAPVAVALAAPGRQSLCWEGLWQHICTAGEDFARAGIVPGSVAAIALPNGPEFLSAFLAVTLRAACAPLDLSLTKSEYRFYLSKINAAALVFADDVSAAVVEVARELGMGLIRIRSGEESAAGVFSVEPICTATGNAPRRETDAAVLLHTSATTDTPKLVPLSRANLRAAAQQDLSALHLTSADRYLSLTPLYHAHGLMASLTQLYSGGGVFCDRAFTAPSLLESVRQFRPTWMSAGVPVLRILLGLAREHPDAFQRSPLRFIRSTGSSPDEELVDSWQRIAGVPLLNGYGLTEIPGVTRNTLSMSRPGSAGISSGADLAVRDETGNFLPPEAEGEIVLRGPALTSGYLDDPKANQEAFRDGWFHTGDIGRLDRDGFLFIAGRKKEMISRGGKRILPLEVDNVLLRHPAVADAATFPIPHRTLEQEPAAAVVLHRAAEVSELELRRFAALQLAAYKVPRKIMFLDQIPRATSGKPKRASLTEQFREFGAPAHASQPDRPPTEIEEPLIAIWRRILTVERISAGDDFFDLGGDSLSAALMLTQVAEAFRLGRNQLPEADFFDHPTVSALARWIAEPVTESRGEPTLQNRILVLENAGKRLPIFCFSTSEQDAYQFRHLSRWLGPEQPFTVVCPVHPVHENRLLSVEEIAGQAVRSIRSLRPHGPYLISGYCYGGVVAFEAARQLMAGGGEVALLALFETPTPGYPKIVRAWKAYWRALTGLSSRFVRGGERPALPPDFWHPILMAKYRPQMFSAPIVHFIGADVRISTRILSDPRLGWRHFAGAGFEARSVPGDHVSILSESRAAALATEFESALGILNPKSQAAVAAAGAQ